MKNQTETSPSGKLNRPIPTLNASCKNFAAPDERRKFHGHGHLDILNFADHVVIGKGVFEPGWKWSVDVKPIAGTTSCEAPHVGYCLEGSMKIVMNSGETFIIKAGDAFQIPPGHDALVMGGTRCVLLDFSGYENYAKPKPQPRQ